MPNYHTNGPLNTIAIYPESGSIFALDPSGSFEIVLTQDYDQKTTTVQAALINTPTEFSPRLVLQVSTSDLPSASGLYTLKLDEAIVEKLKIRWIEAHTIWSETHRKWNGFTERQFNRTIENDRAYVSGSDDPQFTQYVSPDETGAYITYIN